jgi:hypothetical protein
MLNPTLAVVLARPTMLSPRIVVVPKPPPAISRAEIEVVAFVPPTVVVEIKKSPPAFRKVH